MAPENHTPTSGARGFAFARCLLLVATAASFLLVFQNFGFDILPDRVVKIAPSQIRPYSAERTFAYVFGFDGSEGDRWPSPRSRVQFYEDARLYRYRMHKPDEVIVVGGDRFAHEPGRIIFSTVQNDDPRTNGRVYSLVTPVLYTPAVGDTALLVFLVCTVVWIFVCRGSPVIRRPLISSPPWRGHMLAATLLFGIGLYCNTGSLPPYAITLSPIVSPGSGYAYNGDHIHFKVLYDFVDGKPREAWEHAILLRRILFPVLGWPLMKLLGFEIGGTITSLLLNIAAFVASLLILRRWIGERGAIFAAWILALYPGASYWAGLPYTYALIFPLSILLMLGLLRLSRPGDLWVVGAVSLAMGVAYLGYDLAVNFLPASLVVLCWRRRFGAAALSGFLQIIPLGAWLYVLVHVFHQPLENGNSGIYMGVINELRHSSGVEWWWQQAQHALGYGSDIFFAANFIFIPALFLLVLCLNAATSRIRFHVAEVGLLLSGLAVFLVLNLAPSDLGGWEMRGTWISRLYQPVFPALVLFMARWWQVLPPDSGGSSLLAVLCMALASAGNALVVFGPILNDPWHISRDAFYRFYDHTDDHSIYDWNLQDLGRRPLGFPRGPRQANPEGPNAQQDINLAGARKSLEDIQNAIWQNAAALRQVRTTLRDVGRSAADTRSILAAKQLDARLAKGEITAERARLLAKPASAFISPALRAVIDDPSLDGAAGPRPIKAVPETMVGIAAAIDRDTLELLQIERALGDAQNELKRAIAEQASALDELNRFDRGAQAVAKP